MKILQLVTHSGWLGFAVGRLGIGFAPGFAGRGVIVMYRGQQAFQFRVWRFALAWRLELKPCNYREFFCWPRSVMIGTLPNRAPLYHFED